MPPTSPLTRLPGVHARRATVRARRIRVGIALALRLDPRCAPGDLHRRQGADDRASKASSAPSTSAARRGAPKPRPLPPPSRAYSHGRWPPPQPGRGASRTGRTSLSFSGASPHRTSPRKASTRSTPHPGTLTHIANLTARPARRIGCRHRREDVTFGGGAPATVATVQAAACSGPDRAGRHSDRGRQGYRMPPSATSDSSTVTVGRPPTSVGGYDGTDPDPGRAGDHRRPDVLVRRTLQVPVRYPAVAAAGGLLYVFGGEAVTGSDAGQPVSDDPGRGPRIATRLDASGHVARPARRRRRGHHRGADLLAGGESTVAQAVTAGVGTTQLGSATCRRPTPVPESAVAPTTGVHRPQRYPRQRDDLLAASTSTSPPTPQRHAAPGSGSSRLHRRRVDVSAPRPSPHSGRSIPDRDAPDRWASAGARGARRRDGAWAPRPGCGWRVQRSAGVCSPDAHPQPAIRHRRARAPGRRTSACSCSSPTAGTTASWSWTRPCASPGHIHLRPHRPTPTALSSPTMPSSSIRATPSSPTRRERDGRRDRLSIGQDHLGVRHPKQPGHRPGLPT